MPDRGGPKVFTIPVHRNFADALVNGLMAQFGRDRMTLARGIVLVPNNRAVRAITDAFVRRAEPGLLLPRMVAVGDVGGDAQSTIMGVALDPAGGEAVPAAVDPLVRRFIMARMVQQVRSESGARIDAAEALRLATELAATLDTLLAEDISPKALMELEVGNDLSIHWQKSLDLIAMLLDRWPEELVRLGRIDLVERRNILLRRQARAWADAPPSGFVVVAGITTSAKAVAELLRAVARMPNGMVVLPGVDLASPADEWDAIVDGGIESHPQHHLRILLDRMDVARSDVARWRWGDGKARHAVRARAVSNAFAPAFATKKWNSLPAPQRKLPGVRFAEFATPADEAQGIAIALREALETPLRTAALITPDRALAERVVAHLKRWGVNADDSGGRPLSVTPAGTLILAVAGVAVERFAPVALLSLLKHPLVMAGEGRLDWLKGVRSLDLALRGPRPAPGLAGLAAFLAGGEDRVRGLRARAAEWWTDVAPLFQPIETAFSVPQPNLLDLLEAVRAVIEALAGEAVWSGAAGRAASELFTNLTASGGEGPLDFDAAALVPMLEQLLGEVAVRPPQGGHPRVAIWGLLEARLQSADLLICGGLNEGVWPASATPDPWLAPKVRIELGLGGLDRRVGLAAHDLATALGGREVLLTRAKRDARSPTIASRFVLRLEAMLGGIDPDERIVALAQAIDAHDGPAQLETRPAPLPPVALRPKVISVTDVDRLKADPFAFYAKSMLRLSALDDVDAEPTAAWRGTMVHDIFDKWFRDDKLHPDKLVARVAALFDDAGTHPVTRAMWQPRLIEAVNWIAGQVATDKMAGREVIASEINGSTEIAGVTLKGIADRIDRTDGALAIVDYKTGAPPSAKAVESGFSMQLGLLGLIAERGGFEGVSGTPTEFEYWTLRKNKKDGFGERTSPVKSKSTMLTADNFVAFAAEKFSEASDLWLTGNEPFLAKKHPEYAPYADYDHLMRLAEWYGRER
jgi:ATP-dependent helicase/nuclease subunit B